MHNLQINVVMIHSQNTKMSMELSRNLQRGNSAQYTVAFLLWLIKQLQCSHSSAIWCLLSNKTRQTNGYWSSLDWTINAVIVQITIIQRKAVFVWFASILLNIRVNKGTILN